MSSVAPVGKHRRGTLYQVVFPTLPSLKVQPRIAMLKQKQQSHDILVLEYPSSSLKNSKVLKTGVPVKLTWKQGNRKTEWLGYVNSVSRLTSVEKSQPMKIYCVGSSFVLKQRKTKTYKNKTVTEVAKQIAKQNNLRFVGEPHSRRFNQLVISGHSQWKWLHEQASRIGYVMYTQGTDLVFRPIDKLLDEQTTNAPLFQLWDPAIPRSFTQLDRTLDSLELLVGENIEDEYGSRASKQTGGVDPVKGTSFTNKQSPSKIGKSLRTKVGDALFDEFNSEQVVHKKNDSRYASRGAAELARFNIPAKVFGQGDPRLRPYQLVQIEGSGSETDGHWLVREVTHKFGYGGYYNIEMIVSTDGTGKNVRKTPSSTSTSTINVDSILANKSSVNLGVELNRTGNWHSAGNPSETSTSKLVVKRPFLVNVNNQGYSRTPSIWQTKVPTAVPTKKARKCRAC